MNFVSLQTYTNFSPPSPCLILPILLNNNKIAKKRKSARNITVYFYSAFDSITKNGFLIISVVGLNFDFVILNLTKHSSYLIYNVVLFFSTTVQAQYRHKFGSNQVFFFNYFLNFFISFLGIVFVCVFLCKKLVM